MRFRPLHPDFGAQVLDFDIQHGGSAEEIAELRDAYDRFGMLLFRGEGPKLFTDTLESLMYTPEGVKWWYLRAIGQIAEHHQVETCSIEGKLWGEVDFPADHERVSQLVTEF